MPDLAPVENTPPPELKLRTNKHQPWHAKNPFGLTGIWIRNLGDGIHLLIERDQKWFDVGLVQVDSEGGSHIFEVAALEKAKLDTL